MPPGVHRGDPPGTLAAVTAHDGSGTGSVGLAGSTLPLRHGGGIPVVGFGTWRLSGREAYDATRAALDAGYRHIDTATMYGNEAEIGRAIADSGISRDDLFVTTKLPPRAIGRVQATIDASRRDLGLDAVDLWLVHWPPDGEARPDVWAEVLAQRDAGRTRHAGVSNYSTRQIDELVTATGEAPEVNQIRFAPPLFSSSRLARHHERGVIVEGWGGLRSVDLHDPVLTAIAETHGITTAQVVIRWHVQHDVVVIPKSANPARIATNGDVFGFQLSAEEMTRVDGLAG
jgi:2,5-diketo-D-gluconate reductase A